MKKNHPLKDKFVTEGYLDTRLKGTEKQLNAHFEMRFEGFREEVREEIKRGTVTVLQAVDKVLTWLDAWEKDEAAHTMLHKRITDDILDHGKRIRALEAVKTN